MQVKRSLPLSKRGIAVALAVIAGLLWSQYSGDITRILVPSGVAGIPFGRSILASLSDIVVLTGLICMSAMIGVTKIPWLTGFSAPVTRPFIVYFALFGAAALLCALLTPIRPELNGWTIAWRGVGGPIAEEIVYRGLAVGALMRLAGWRFVPAILLPALVFGLAHIVQGEDLTNSALIVAITAVGGLLFGWLFVRWGFNLWPAIFAHAGMNTLWEVFAFGETAIGDWFGNAMRLGLVVFMLATTFYFAPKPKQT